MDFDFHYTKEQEEFRKEVRTFIEENALKKPRGAARKITLEEFHKGREISRKLGVRGWFAPNYPKEYGGGGLDTEHCLILGEEFVKVQEEHRWLGSTQVNAIHVAGLMTYGSEEQKRRLLTPMLRGEWEGAQCFTEPEAGTDEASQKSTAIRHGDVYVINGDKVFVGQAPIGGAPFDYLYWTAITDVQAPRHQNLGAFLMRGDLPGITYTPLDLIAAEAGQKWEIVCEDVCCPADRLIGGETQGWQVAQASLEVEHGGAGSLLPRNRLVLSLIDYCKKTPRNGQPISKDPKVQDILVQAYIEFEAERLWGIRNYAMAQGQIPRVPYTGTQTRLHEKRFSPQLARILLDSLGPYCLLDDPELQVLLGEVQRVAIMGDVTHIAGTPETYQIMMSRALGLGRGAARAAAPAGR